eukprot:scaffold72998_cov65-Phaeocystis_antarctica.AAC.4
MDTCKLGVHRGILSRKANTIPSIGRTKTVRTRQLRPGPPCLLALLEGRQIDSALRILRRHPRTLTLRCRRRRRRRHRHRRHLHHAPSHDSNPTLHVTELSQHESPTSCATVWLRPRPRTLPHAALPSRMASLCTSLGRTLRISSTQNPLHSICASTVFIHQPGIRTARLARFRRAIALLVRRHGVHTMKLSMLLISVLFLATDLEAVAPTSLSTSTSTSPSPSPMAPWEKCGGLEKRVKRDGAGREGARDDDGALAVARLLLAHGGRVHHRRELRQLVGLRVHPTEKLHALEILVLGQHGGPHRMKKMCCRDECKENTRKNKMCEKKCMDLRRDDEVGDGDVHDGDDGSEDGDSDGNGEDGSGDKDEDNKKCDELKDKKGWTKTCTKSLRMCTTKKGKTGKKGKREKKCERNAMQFCQLVGKNTPAICEKTCCDKGY